MANNTQYSINKVIDNSNNVLLDLTEETIEPSKALIGVVFVNSNGLTQTGTISTYVGQYQNLTE